MAQKLLITGANGKMGRLVTEILVTQLGHDPQDIVLTTRDISALKDAREMGFDVREADFARPDTLDAAFAGVDNLLLISIDAIGQRTELHRNAVKAAERAGIRHLTYTSMPSPENSPVVFAHEHEATEQAIAQSDIPAWTVLRNNWYYENLIEFFASVLQTGAWLTSAGAGKAAQISREDLALAAAVALSKGGSKRQVLTLNGPEALSVAEMAGAINAEIGTEISVIDLEDQALQAQLESFGVPAEAVAMTVSLDHHNRIGLSAGDSTEFETLTGKRPQSYVAWLQAKRSELTALAAGRN